MATPKLSEVLKYKREVGKCVHKTNTGSTFEVVKHKLL